jgi:hypothetical protein
VELERIEAQRAEEREAAREAMLARLLPIWEANLEAIAVNEAIEREAARDAQRAADPSSFTALLNRRRC